MGNFWARYGSLFAAVLILFIAALLFRPLLPIDETRYLSVAWEMHLKRDWFLLTMNFEPYHHKPPLLFWLINIAWSIFGVSRWTAMIPLFIASCANLVLIRELTKRVLPAYPSAADRAPLLMLGSAPFWIYCTMIMFDVTLMALVMGALIAMLSFAEKRTIAAALTMGLLLGLGVLTKGPVAYLYTLPPMLLAPFWLSARDDGNKLTWYGGCLAAVCVSVLPVLMWLVPTLQENGDRNFAFWLLWNQTAGRITGNFSAAHVRPIYFYALLLPVLVLPWAFLPSFWRSIKQSHWPHGFRFLSLWFAPVFLAFSFISGKQPHYLVPLLPGVIVALAYGLRHTADRTLSSVVALCLSAYVIGHVTAGLTVFKNYDLRPVADYLRVHPAETIAFAGTYHGELGYLARLERPVTSILRGDVDSWLNAHPGAVVIDPKIKTEVPLAHDTIFEAPYRSGRMAIFQ